MAADERTVILLIIIKSLVHMLPYWMSGVCPARHTHASSLASHCCNCLAEPSHNIRFLKCCVQCGATGLLGLLGPNQGLLAHLKIAQIAHKTHQHVRCCPAGHSGSRALAIQSLNVGCKIPRATGGWKDKHYRGEDHSAKHFH